MLKIEAVFDMKYKDDFVRHFVNRVEKRGYKVSMGYMSGEYDIFISDAMNTPILRAIIDQKSKPSHVAKYDNLSYIEIEGYSYVSVYILNEVIQTTFIQLDFLV
jgi:hypothetical protein